MRERLVEAIQGALETLLAEAGAEVEVPAFAVDVPRQADHGDFACNAAMLLAKALRKPPREIAQRLADVLGDAGGLVDRTEIAGPGFLNLWLAGARWQDVLGRILESGSGFGRSDSLKAARIQVEFVSANPTGPLSIGHGRQAVLGDCIARLLDAVGADVTREYYFNNGGRQMRVLGDSVRARYLELLGRAAAPPAEALRDKDAAWPEEIDGLPVAFPRDGYQGDYIVKIARGVEQEHGEGWVDEPGEGGFREVAESTIFAEIKKTLAPFDRIIVTAAAREKPPEKLIEQLKVGGIMVAPVGESGKQMLKRYKKESEDTYAISDIMPVRFVPLLPDVARDEIREEVVA